MAKVNKNWKLDKLNQKRHKLTPLVARSPRGLSATAKLELLDNFNAVLAGIENLDGNKNANEQVEWNEYTAHELAAMLWQTNPDMTIAKVQEYTNGFND